MKTLIVAPHPDDELLGCGGTLLRRVDEGGPAARLLMTTITKEAGWAAEKFINEPQRLGECARAFKSLITTSTRLVSLQ